MKLLILIDKLNWAYHSIAKCIQKYNRTDVNIDVLPIKGNVSSIKKIYKKYDCVFVMGWQNYSLVEFIPKNITITGVHSFHSWDKGKTTPDKSAIPPTTLIKFLSKFNRVNVVSQRLFEVFQKSGLDVVYTANGVDTDIFKCMCDRPIGKTITVGYSGSKAHDWRKGVSQFILPAAKQSKVNAKLAMANTDQYISLSKMYKFYNKIDCYICASSSEGMSLSVLEAAACGCPIITTRCGGSTEIIKEGKTGFFVNRTVNDIVDKINILKNIDLLKQMSDATVKDIKENWGWNVRASKWIDFVEGS